MNIYNEKKSKITLSLYPSTINKLKLYATEHNTTVSQLLEDYSFELKTKSKSNYDNVYYSNIER